VVSSEGLDGPRIVDYNTGAAMTTNEAPTARRHMLPVLVAAVGALFFLGSGLWAMVGPESFFDAAAPFEPYSQHFIQDIGAFMIGLGAVLALAAAVRRVDGLIVALLGAGAGSTTHVVSHIVGHDLGGNPEVDIGAAQRSQRPAPRRWLPAGEGARGLTQAGEAPAWRVRRL